MVFNYKKLEDVAARKSLYFSNINFVPITD